MGWNAEGRGWVITGYGGTMSAVMRVITLFLELKYLLSCHTAAKPLSPVFQPGSDAAVQKGWLDGVRPQAGCSRDISPFQSRMPLGWGPLQHSKQSPWTCPICCPGHLFVPIGYKVITNQAGATFSGYFFAKAFQTQKGGGVRSLAQIPSHPVLCRDAEEQFFNV